MYNITHLSVGETKIIKVIQIDIYEFHYRPKIAWIKKRATIKLK